MLDWLLPQRCVACRSPGAQLCTSCAGAIRGIAPPLCHRCGAPTVWPVERCRECAGRRLAFARARAAVAYDATARRVVAAWKEHAVRGLVRWAVEAVATGIPPPSVDCVTFVPPDRERQLKRSVHPAEALARELADRWSVNVEPLVLRSRASDRQRGLPRHVRKRNVSGAFAAARSVPARIALVDDVYTTGATANAASSALRKGGAGHVEVVTFARALRVR